MIGRKEPAAQLAEQLEPEELATATARGARMSLDEAIELVVDILESLPGTSPTT
jgi:hypothetical protein